MWQEFSEFVSGQIHDHWVKFLMALGIAAVGWYFGKRRAQGQWQKKEFLHRLHVSLNVIHPGAPLQIRTILEKGCDEIFLNSVAAEAVGTAARKTTPQNPLLPLPKADYWYYLNSVLNEIAEKFSAGQIRRDLGQPTTNGKYLICLTCEYADEMRQRKIRAMVIQKQTLVALPAECPPLEQPWHAERWKTLNFLAAEYRKNPHQFLEMDISV